MRDDVMIRFGTEAEKQTLLTEYPEIKNVILDGGYFIVTGGDENEKDDRRIWDGEISPQDNLISDNQEYRELQHQQSKNKAELLEALSDEQKELLKKFCATEIELNGISEREAFTAGFKIAMRLAAEAFYGADNE